MDSFLHALAFLATIIGAFLVPGFIWWRAVFGRSFSLWEELVYAFLGSLAIIDLIMLILGRVGLPLSLSFVGGSLFLFTALGAAIAWKRKGQSEEETDVLSGLRFSASGKKLFLVLFALTIFIRTLFLAPNILPTATDLGHHVYWADQIVATEKLPVYEKIEIVTDAATGAAAIAAPKPIADFIIGEHLPLAFLSKLSGLSFTSAFPILFLHFINILSIVAVTALAFRLARALQGKLGSALDPERVALFVFLILGPLFALASPQARFVSGGVVGNIFGNLFIPAVLILFYRGLTEKKAPFLAAGLFLSFILAYTHHLSTLILAFILLGTLGLAIVSLLFAKQAFLSDWLRLARSPAVLSFCFGAIFFMALVALPSYLDTAAIDSAIGTPTKTTRTGLSFFQISNSIGLAKVALGGFGLLLALFAIRRQPFAASFVLGWGGLLLVMAMYPNLLFLDIPSGRVASYLSYPLALAAGIGLAWILQSLSDARSLPRPLSFIILAALAVFTLGSGTFDNASSLSFKDRSRELVQTFAATEYLARHTDGEMILKDHNYLSADAWMKLFFHRDYGYPLSRGLFGRYEEGGNRRERCSLAMISTPNTEAGVRCYDETDVRYLVVNPLYDSAQFEKTESFSKLYSSESAAIFERNEE